MICRANCLLMALLAATGGAKIRRRPATSHFYWIDRDGEAWDFFPMASPFLHFPRNLLFLGSVRRRAKWDEPR